MARVGSRRLIVAMLIVLASTLASCLPPATFTVTLPARAGDPGRDPLPVVLEDASGFADALEVGIVGFRGEQLPAAVAVAGQAAALQIHWVGGLCDKQATLALSSSGNGLRLVITTDRANACRGAGIERAVIIRFRQPIQPAQLEIVEQND